MSQPYTFSPVRWDMTTQRPVTTGHIQADAGSGRRTEANRNRAKGGSALPQPLMSSHTASSPSFESFEDVSDFIAAIQSGNPSAVASISVYGRSAVARAVGTGQVARGRRR